MVVLNAIPAASAQGKPLMPVNVENSRDKRFCEILVVKATGIEIYNTTGLNDCPSKLWEALDLEQLKKDWGALKIGKNGPKYWMMDSQTLRLGEKASFGGIDARWAAALDPAAAQKAIHGVEPYKPFTTKKTQKMVYAKGKAVYELVDPQGNVYVLQARAERVPMSSLPKLAEKMTKLPKDWTYRTRTLTQDLVLDLKADKTIYALEDEFLQVYTRIAGDSPSK